MTRRQLHKRIAYWQKRLGLGGWEIYLSLVPPSDDALAETHPDLVNKHAAICFRADTPESQYDRLIVHELGHLLTAEMHDLFDRAVEDHQAEAQNVFRSQWHRSEEWALERLATAFTGEQRVEFNEDVHPAWREATLVR